MSLPAVYQTLWAPGVLRANPVFLYGLREWLRSGSYAPTQIKGKICRLAIHDVAGFIDAQTNDFVKLGTAAFESATAVEPVANHPERAAWVVISQYYSSYFAANALMRLCGDACVNLDAETCAALNESLSLYELGGSGKNRLSPGVYAVSLSQRGVAEVVLRDMSGQRGGVHAQFWAGFLGFVDRITSEIRDSPATSSEKARALSELSRLRDNLCRAGRANGSWLSEVRNSVNYRLAYNVWYPYDRPAASSNGLRRTLKDVLIGDAELVVATSDIDDCEASATVCGFFLNWLESSLRVVLAKSQRSKKKYIAEGALAFAGSL